jgi:hypothetical protein
MLGNIRAVARSRLASVAPNAEPEIIRSGHDAGQGRFDKAARRRLKVTAQMDYVFPVSWIRSLEDAATGSLTAALSSVATCETRDDNAPIPTHSSCARKRANMSKKEQPRQMAAKQ